MLFGLPGISDAFDIEPDDSQVKQAVRIGKKHKGIEIFDSPIVKNARLGKYPRGEGAMIMTKYIEIAVISAMREKGEKAITPEDIAEVQNAKTLKVIAMIIGENIQTPGAVQIMLKQGGDFLLPMKTEFGMAYKDDRQSIVGHFQYEKIDPDATTKIYVKTSKEERKYKIDFSDIK